MSSETSPPNFATACQHGERQGILNKRKGSVRMTSLNKSLDELFLMLEKYKFLFHKTSCRNVEVNGTEPFPLARLPWLRLCISPFIREMIFF
jgi:hypothetical protein